MADPHQPEYRLDIQMMDRKGTVSEHYEFYAWDGSEWHSLPMTGGAAISHGSPAIIELQIPKALLGNPQIVNLGVVSTGRGRVHTAGDILGTDVSPSEWREPVTLNVFASYVMSDSP